VDSTRSAVAQQLIAATLYDPSRGLGRRRVVNDDEAATFDVCARIARLAALDEASAVIVALQSVSDGPGSLARSLHRNQLGPLVRRALAAADDGSFVTSEVQALLDELPTAPRAAPRELMDAFAILRDALEARDIPVLLLKGAVLAARLYGDLDRRPQYDIDVLVKRRDARRARRVLASIGYRRRSRDGHSVSYARGSIHVDLHHALRSSPAYAIDEAAIWRRARPDIIAGTGVRTLADDDTLSLLTMSVVEDVGFGMAKLKNLCDIWLLARQLDPVTDWDLWFATRRAEHLEEVAVNGCALALAIMAAPPDAPRLADALDRRPHLVRVADRRHALALMTSGRGSAGNIAWLGSVYPGSLLRLRLHSVVAGLPARIRDVRPSVGFQARVRRELRAARRVQPKR
jgi:hypothetical protein